MKKYLPLLLIMLFSITSLTAKSEFKFKGNVINPACIKLMKPWISDNGVIIKQVVLDQCQNSNLAYEGIDSYKKGETSFYNSDGEYFEYKVLGSLEGEVYYLFHGGYIAKYQITEEEIVTSLIDRDKSKVTVLTKLSNDTFIPCFKSAEIKNNFLVVTKKDFDPYKARAFQCGNKNEELIIK